MPLTVEQFTQRLTSSGVMSDDAVRDWFAAIPVEQRAADGEALAKALVREKQLTKFQAEQIYAGKEKSLTLGNYVILDKLGQGGMGMVLKAQHRRMGRVVALKVMSPAAVKSVDAVKRFHREVQTAAKLTHPNIVTAFDADEAKGTHFLVMEYVEGDDLSQLVKKHGALSVEQAIECILQAARGLAHAHKEGVVHRDIKPANLLLDKNGTVKILDMGLARLDSGLSDAGGVEGAGLTQSGTIMGTVDYMSPEQAEDTRHADARSDIYSLGCSLFYLLTGHVVFGGETMMKKLLAHRDTPIPELSGEWRVGSGERGTKEILPTPHSSLPALNSVFRKMLAKKPGDRQQSMLEVIADLERCRAGEGVTVNVNAVGGEATSGYELQKFLRQISGEEGSQVTSAGTIGTSTTPVDATAETMLLKANGAGTDPQTEMTLAYERSRRAAGANRTRNAVLAAVAVVVLLFGGVWLFRTPRGVMQIEITDEQAEVTFGETGRVLRGATNEAIKLPIGEHVLHVTVGETQFDTPEITVAKGEPVAIKVERVGNRVRVMRGKDFLVAKELPRSKTNSVATANSKAVSGVQGTTPADFALRFDGVGQYVTASVSLPIEKPWTLERWVTPQQAPPVTEPSNFLGGDMIGFGLKNLPLRGLRWQAYYVGARDKDRAYQSDLEAVLNQPAHLAVVYGGGNVTFFVNGVPQGHPRPFRPKPGETTVSLGPSQWSASDGRPGYHGILDEVRVSSNARYKDAFTPARRFEPDQHTLALLHFDEGSGDELKDSSGNNHHGKIVGAKWVTADAKPIESSENFALEFEGSQQVLLDSVRLPLEGPITFEATVEFLETVAKDGVAGNVVGSGKHLNLYYQPQLRLIFGANVPTGIQRADGGSLGPLRGRRVQLAGVLDANELRIFVDGKRLGKSGVVLPLVPPTEPFLIGGNFRGVIDEVRVSKLARYSTDYVPSERLQPDEHTLALYHFDEGSGDVLKDSSGNNHHGKIVGAKWVKANLKSEISNLKSQISEVSSPYEILTSSDYEWSQPENLGAVVNSEDAESSPFLSADGLTLLFDSGRPNGQGKQDLWMSRRATLDAAWSAPQNMGAAVNSAANEKGPTISTNGLTLVFGSDRERDEKYQLWTATRKTTADPWSPPQRINLGPATSASDEEPELSADGLTLFFHSTRANGQGGEDLWMLRRKTRIDVRGPPENLGPVVNSRSREFSSALSSDNRVLVFSSDRDGGQGRPDLWLSSRPSADAAWSAPINLGAVVNTFADELAPTLSADGRTLIFRSNRPGTMAKGVQPDLWVSRRVLKPEAAARLKAANTFTNSLGMEFVRVPKGKSWLGGGAGKPGTQEVTIPDDFYLGKYEVTQGEWQQVMGKNPSHFCRSGASKETVKNLSDADLQRLPVEGVSWNASQEFVTRLNETHPVPGWVYRLPTQAEWEYACRGGPLSQKDDSGFDFTLEVPTNTLAPDRARFDAFTKGTAQVGSYPPNRLGLHDMHGNVFEWCADELPADAKGAPQRASKGGGFWSKALNCRAFDFYRRGPSHTESNLGLRVARVPIAGQWQPLFNGKDLTGLTKTNPTFNTGKAEVVLEDGQPALRLTKPYGLATPAFGNYHLRLDCKTDPFGGGIHHLFVGDSLRLRIEWQAKSTPPTIVLSGNGLTFQKAELRDGRLLPIGATLTDKDPVAFAVPSLDPSGWQRVEIVRLDDAFVYSINGKLVGAITNLRTLADTPPKTPGRSPIEFYTTAKQSLFRNIELREITALPPEVANQNLP